MKLEVAILESINYEAETHKHWKIVLTGNETVKENNEKKKNTEKEMKNHKGTREKQNIPTFLLSPTMPPINQLEGRVQRRAFLNFISYCTLNKQK